MDVKLINPFVEATLNILETMAQTKAEAGTPYVKKATVDRGDVSAISYQLETRRSNILS